MGFFSEKSGVDGPGDVICNLHPKKLSTADSLNSSPVDGKRGMLPAAFSEVQDHLLGFLHIWGEVVVFTPPDQLLHPLSSQYSVSSLLVMRLTTVVSSANFMI